jgi:hypothetical protein
LKIGSKIRILRKADKPFDKKVQKYNETVHKIEKFIHGGGLIKVKDKSRLLRPFEVLPVDKGIEKNPFVRKITSPDVEKALEKGRKRRSEKRDNDEDDSNGQNWDDDEVPEPREKRQQTPRKPIEAVLDAVKKRKPSADPEPYVQQHVPVAFVDNSKYRIKWVEKNHTDYGKALSVSIKDVDIKKGTCSIQYYRTGNWNVNQSLSNFDVIDKRNNKIPMIITENVPESIPEKSKPEAKNAVVENNNKYKIKWIEAGHHDYGKSFSVTIKDVENDTCSIQYYRTGKWQENQSLLNFEVVGKLGVSPTIIKPPPPNVKEKAPIAEKSITPPRALVENDVKYRIRHLTSSVGGPHQVTHENLRRWNTELDSINFFDPGFLRSKEVKAGVYPESKVEN